MRYIGVPKIAFLDYNGKTHSIRDLREIPDYTLMTTLTRRGGEDIDEIASRTEVYGETGESLAYKIHEANIIAILDAGLDYTNIKKVAVPE